MKRSMKFKILSATLVAFTVATVATVLVAGRYQKDVIDNQQESFYFEKLSAIINLLNRYEQELAQTGMAELYGEEARQNALEEIRRLYYQGENQQIYPFIMTEEGAFILHPSLAANDNIRDFSFGTKALAIKEGELEYTYEGREKWMRICYFEPWKWIVGFAIPTEIKYAATVQLRNALIITMCVITALVMLTFSLFISKKTIQPVKAITDRLRESSQTVLSGSEQISSASHSLARSAATQASFLEEIASATEEMAAIATQNQKNTQGANTLMQTVRQVLENANQNMETLARAMSDISDSSSQTSRIIKTIDEIAFQTNLLALNAAVEAARAGEAGAGFAVVADEVRNLAKRAADAAKTTAELIEKTREKIVEGDDLVDITVGGYKEVTTSVADAEVLLNDISSAILKQTQGISQINKSVMEMDGMVQQNAANTEEAASASEQMRDESGRLLGMVMELLTLFQGTAGIDRAASVKKLPEPETGRLQATRRKSSAKALANKIVPNKIIPLGEFEPSAF